VTDGFHEEEFAPDKSVLLGKRRGNSSDQTRFPLIPFRELRLGRTQSYLVKGVIPRTGIVTVWGPPKCGKSFWTFDLVMHLALGWQYRGLRVVQGSVVYCAFEGAEGFKARAEAFRRHHDISADRDIPFYLSPAHAKLVRDHKALIRSIKMQSVKPVAVVLDTLNRSIDGSESKDEDMGAYLSAAEAINQAFGCVIIIVHHCGVDSTRPRGHTSLTGTTDAQLAVRRDASRNVIVQVEWMKDGPEGAEFASRLEVVNLGIDDDGDSVESCVIMPLSTSEVSAAASPQKSKKQQKWESSLLRRVMMTVLAEHGREMHPIPEGPALRVVDQEIARAEFYRSCAADGDEKAKQATRQRRFRRAVDDARDNRHIGVREIGNVTYLWFWLDVEAEPSRQGQVSDACAEREDINATETPDRTVVQYPDSPDSRTSLLEKEMSGPLSGLCKEGQAGQKGPDRTRTKPGQMSGRTVRALASDA